MFFQKKIDFNVIWITFSTFLEQFEATKLQQLGSQMKKLTYPASLAPHLHTGQVQNTFLSDLAKAKSELNTPKAHLVE